MSSPRLSSWTISEKTATFLEGEGLLTPIVNNKRKVSTSILSPPPSESSSRSSSAHSVSAASFQASFVSEQVDEVEIPADLRSLEAYIYIGFDAATAALLWHRYVNFADEVQGDFFDFALWHLEFSNVPDATSGEDDWDACMKALGINDKTRAAILLPEFEDIRYTATCRFWVKDTLKLNYEALEDLDDNLRMAAARIQHSKKVPRSRTAPHSLITSSSSPINPATESRSFAPLSPPSEPTVTLPEAKSSTNPLSSEGNESSVHAAAATVAPVSLPGHTILWRACSRRDAEAFYNHHTQEINLHVISTYPGDFSASRVVASWTPQKETADRYAQWAKHTAKDEEIAIIQVAVPEVFTRTLTTEYLWFGDRERSTDLWKKVIWHCRRGVEFPEELDHLTQKDLLIGHIASGKHRKYERMAHYNQIDEGDVLTIEVDGTGRKSVQWIFQTSKAKRGFQEHCQGKVWIHNLGRLRVPVPKD